MTSYNRQSNPCFIGTLTIALANETLKQVQNLKKGDVVITLTDPYDMMSDKTTAAQIMKLTKNAAKIFDELEIYPYNCNMWYDFSRQTGNWSVGILKTAVFHDPNSSILTSKDALILKEFLLENPDFHNKYKI